jgi:hypothetical protein
MTSDNADIARLWAKGLTGDLAQLGALMSPSTRIWHSHDGVWLTLQQSAARMPEPSGVTAAFADIRAQTTDTGVLIQATLPGASAGADPTHVVQVLTVDNGVVVQVEEYIAGQTAHAGSVSP